MRRRWSDTGGEVVGVAWRWLGWGVAGLAVAAGGCEAWRGAPGGPGEPRSKSWGGGGV